jgi:hypothetical protein
MNNRANGSRLSTQGGALSQQVLSCLRHLVPGGGSSLVVATRSRRCHHTKRRTRRLQG